MIIRVAFYSDLHAEPQSLFLPIRAKALVEKSHILLVWIITCVMDGLMSLPVHVSFQKRTRPILSALFPIM